MKKITLPKWAVLQSIDGGRLIHVGNGEFVSADTQTPKIVETCVPSDQLTDAPVDIQAIDAPEYQLTFTLGSFAVSKPVDAAPAANAADAANAELTAETVTETA